MTDTRERPSSAQTPPPQMGSSESRSALSLARLPHSETVITSERRTPGIEAHELPPPSSSLCSVLFPIPEAVPEMGSPVGVELGHFRIVAPIRSGGMGAVFEALDLRLNRSVALKILPPNQSRDPAAIERFRNEAQAAAQLDHENIARVFFIGEEQGLHFIAFEFIRGINLRELVLQKGRLAPAEAVNYTLQTALALDHASTSGVVHRDIKPSNIIITPQGRAKLVDLGLARNENRDASRDLTAAGTTLGTFDYISPEQAKDPRNVDVRSDIYSLGCTLYHMLTGEPPYPEGTVLQKLLDHSGKESPDPRLKNRLVSVELSTIVRKMMESDPRKRYQTAQQLIHELYRVAHQLGLRSLSSDRLVFLSDENRRKPSVWEQHGSWIATTLALLLIIALLRFGIEPPSTPGLAEQGGEPGALQPDREFEDSNPQIATSGNLPSGNSTTNGTESITSIPLVADSATGASTPANSGTVDDNLPGAANGTGVANHATPGEDGNTLTAPRPPSDVFPGTTESGRDSPSPASRVFGPSPLANSSFRPDLYPTGPLGIALPHVETLPTEESPTTASTRPMTSGTNSAETPMTGASATPAETSLQPSIALLRPDGSSTQSFPTLESACAEAKDAHIIELRFNGVRQESPLRINSKITIRAGKGFKPILEFIPKQIPGSGYETRMMTLTSGALDLVDVQLRMPVTEGIPSENWVLLTAHRPDAVRIIRSAIVIRNPAHLPATVLEIRGGATRSAMDSEMSKLNMMQAPLALDFEESFISGGADLLQLRAQLPGRLSLKHCLVALEGTLLRSDIVSDLSESQSTVEFRIDHVTAILNQGLLRFQGGNNGSRKLSRVIVTASNSIFSTAVEPGTPLQPFVEMLGNTAADDLRELLVWNGQSNFYDRYSTFWAISSANGAQMETSSFPDWKRHWGSNEISSQAVAVPWNSEWAGRPYWDSRPSDFGLLRTNVENPAVASGNGGEDAGADISRISKLLPLTQPSPSGK